LNPPGRPAPRGMVRSVAPAAALAMAVLFIALGIWQVERRAWKHALIAAVDARIHAAPAAAPGPAQWTAITAERDAYRRVSATGHFLQGRDTLVRATTELGAGYWVLTPFRAADFTLLVNRGFVPPERRASVAPPPSGEARVTGLLRISEPGGGFLRRNDPAAGRWYSRDVNAIAAVRGLGPVAPYFVDADGSSDMPSGPVGGLTVVRFSDNHLGYALTWFALAVLSAWGGWLLLRDARRPAAQR